MTFALQDPRGLGIWITLVGLGVWFLWRLRPGTSVTDRDSAAEARLRILRGLTWCMGAASGLGVIWWWPIGDWTLAIGLPIVLIGAVKGIPLLYHGVLAGFAATSSTGEAAGNRALRRRHEREEEARERSMQSK